MLPFDGNLLRQRARETRGARGRRVVAAGTGTGFRADGGPCCKVRERLSEDNTGFQSRNIVEKLLQRSSRWLQCIHDMIGQWLLSTWWRRQASIAPAVALHGTERAAQGSETACTQ